MTPPPTPLSTIINSAAVLVSGCVAIPAKWSNSGRALSLAQNKAGPATVKKARQQVLVLCDKSAFRLTPLFI